MARTGGFVSYRGCCGVSNDIDSRRGARGVCLKVLINYRTYMLRTCVLEPVAFESL